MSLAANLRSSDYLVISDVISRKVSTTRTENEMLFVPISSQTSGSVVFKADAQQTYYIDNISVQEVDAIVTNIDDSIKFVE